jgi:hypothetical protein
MDNSSIHKSKGSLQKSRVCRCNSHLICHTRRILLHLTFSYFGKTQMIEREFDSPEDLIRWIRVGFLRISRDTIERVFDKWIDRIERCISHEGFYFPEE